MKFKSRLYQLKKTPIWFRLVFGVVLLLAFILSLIFKWIFAIIYFVYKIFTVFNERKIIPIIEKINNYLYQRACQTFECKGELEIENYRQPEFDIHIPFLIKIRGYFVKVICFLFKKKRRKRVKNNSFVSDKKVFHENKTGVSKLKSALSGYLAWLHTLFEPEFE